MSDLFGISLLVIPRRIGPFFAQCTVEEHHLDELQITEHPVEAGAAITDHAFKRPAQLVLQVGWSNSSLEAAGDQNFINYVYEQLLFAQLNRQPMQVVTGKRTYNNMLIKLLDTRTTSKSEHSLPITIRCQEIILAQTVTVSVPDNSVMANAPVTGTTQKLGTQGLVDGSKINISKLPPLRGASAAG